MKLKEFKNLPVGAKVYLYGDMGTKKSDMEIEFPDEIFIIEDEDMLLEVELAVYDKILGDDVNEDFVTIEKLQKIKCDYYTIQVPDVESPSAVLFTSNDIMDCVRFYKKHKFLKDNVWFIVPQQFNTKFVDCEDFIYNR